jgi:flagellar L-ring protein precursor FlgH
MNPMTMTHTCTKLALAASFGAAFALAPAGIAEEAPSGSLMARQIDNAPPQSEDGAAHALLDSSMFAMPVPKPRKFAPHDLVQIIVSESSSTESSQETETKKDYSLDGSITAWPDLRLSDLLQLQLIAGSTTNLPSVGVDTKKDFKGEGDYKREDDFTARLTAEVVEILPNGNLILEARTHIKTDKEENTIRVTGVCRQEDVTGANTILSSLMHDLKVEKMHKGELRKNTEKGLITKVFDAIFAF